MQAKSAGFLAHLETLGVDGVREALSKHEFGDISDSSNWRVKTANEWLALKLASLLEANEAEALDIAKEANEIARSASFAATSAAAAASEANEIARSNRRIAIAAAIIAIAAAISQIIWR